MNGISIHKISHPETATKSTALLQAPGVILRSQYDAQFVLCLNEKRLLSQNNLGRLLEYGSTFLSWEQFNKQVVPDDNKIIHHLFETAVKFWEESRHVTCNLKLAFTLKTRKNNKKRVLAIVSAPVSAKGAIDSLHMVLSDISFLGNQMGVVWEICNNLKEKERFRTLFNKKFNDIFTQREVEVIEWVCKGNTTQEIASMLFLSQHTISTHRKNILRKSNCHNTEQLLSFCRERGIIS